jgi:hypothetical protein
VHYLKGCITAIQQHAGCVEVHIEGERPGIFEIDNCCLPGILDAEEGQLIGRQIEYEDGFLQFCDTPVSTPEYTS